MKFIYCFDEVTKEKLLNNGYKLMKDECFEGKKAYVFFNCGNKLEFDKNQVMYTNIMHFKGGEI